MSIPITLKWGKTTHAGDGQLVIRPGAPSRDFKLRVQSLTGVPIHRQKLLCPKAWKGPLKDEFPSDVAAPKGKKAVVVTLIGSAETLVETPAEERPRFEEDMTPEEVWRATRGDAAVEEGDVVDIPALQKEAGMERDDGKMETYQYNRMVTGLPQRQINDALVRRKNEGEGGRGDDPNDNHGEKPQSTMPLEGEVAMTLGMELRRAYINSLAVLADGTIVSGLDDGHVQLWRRGRMVKDARPLGHGSSKVDHVLPFPTSSSANDGPSFVTAGDGSICLWSDEGERMMQFGSFPGTTPASIAAGSVADGAGEVHHYLAACFRVTREVDPNQFRLVPQNEAERRRREAAEAQERMIQNELARVSTVVQVWYYNRNGSTTARMREEAILPNTAEGTTVAPPTTRLLDMDGILACADARGGLHVYEWNQGAEPNVNNLPSTSWRQCNLLQFRGSSIACMERLDKDLVAVSIEPGQESSILPSATSLSVPRPRGVYVVNMKEATIKAVLDAHTDAVRCICPLPDGGLLTAGGKMDATVRVWDLSAGALREDQEEGDDVKVLTEAKVMKEPGYVFDLKVLPDSKGSAVYAVAAARYNVIKIVI